MTETVQEDFDPTKEEFDENFEFEPAYDLDEDRPGEENEEEGLPPEEEHERDPEFETVLPGDEPTEEPADQKATTEKVTDRVMELASVAAPAPAWPLKGLKRFSRTSVNNGHHVEQINRALGLEGDVYDARTEEAVRKFQKENGLAPVGYVSIRTWNKLFSKGGDN